MDVIIELNTGEGGYNTFTTENLTGELKAVILQCDELLGTDVEIVSELGYLIFKRSTNRGSSYNAIKLQCLTPENS